MASSRCGDCRSVHKRTNTSSMPAPDRGRRHAYRGNSRHCVHHKMPPNGTPDREANVTYEAMQQGSDNKARAKRLGQIGQRGARDQNPDRCGREGLQRCASPMSLAWQSFGRGFVHSRLAAFARRARPTGSRRLVSRNKPLRMSSTDWLKPVPSKAVGDRGASCDFGWYRKYHWHSWPRQR